MLRVRVVPVLLVRGQGLVKTRKFKDPQYIGDAVNSARIFNEMGVDELFVFDIDATTRGHGVQFPLIEKIVSECFMPVCYGGGVKSIEEFRRLFRSGVEKVSVSSLIFDNPATVRSAVDRFGAQSVVATLDVRWSRVRRRYVVTTHSGRRTLALSLEAAMGLLERLQVGEIVVQHIGREGTWGGFDCELLSRVSSMTDVPVVALGGGGSLEHVRQAVNSGASAVALGSMAVFQSQGMGVLINFPALSELEELLR